LIASDNHYKGNMLNKALVIGNAIAFLIGTPKKMDGIITSYTMDEVLLVFIFHPNAMKFLQLNVFHAQCLNSCV